MKKLFMFVAALVMALGLAQIAVADTLTMPDPLEMGFDMEFAENLDNEHAYYRKYVMDDRKDISGVVLAYIEKLMQYKELKHVQCTTSPGGWIHHVFDAAENNSFDTFCFDEGDWKTADGCVMIQYRSDGDTVYFVYSTDFTLASVTVKPTARPTVKVTAKPTAKPTAKVTAKPTAKPTKKPTGTECPECEGTGKCQKCGGDMWFWGWEWKYVNGSPESVNVNKLCDAVYCYGGSCDKCDGDGWLN